MPKESHAERVRVRVVRSLQGAAASNLDLVRVRVRVRWFGFRLGLGRRRCRRPTPRRPRPLTAAVQAVAAAPAPPPSRYCRSQLRRARRPDDVHEGGLEKGVPTVQPERKTGLGWGGPQEMREALPGDGREALCEVQACTPASEPSHRAGMGGEGQRGKIYIRHFPLASPSLP